MPSGSISIGIGPEARIVLIDGVVGQMNEWIVVGLLLVLLGRKSSQAIPESKYSKRLDVGNQDVDTEIELVLVDQIRVLNVFLDDEMLRHINLVKPFGNEDSFPLRESLGLHDEVGPRICGAIALQVLKLVWKEPCFWKELKICWKLLLHSVEVACKVILSSDLIHPWEMVDLLERFHVLPAI